MPSTRFPDILHGVAVLGDMIFAGENSTLGAYRVGDGSPIWQGVIPDDNNRGVGFNHTIAGNLLLTNNQFLFNCAAFEAATGKLLWIQGKGKGTIYNSPICDGKNWYICLRDDILTRIDLDTGKILETVKMARGFNLLRSRPAFQGKRLVSGSRLQGVTFHDPLGKAQMSFYKTGPTRLPFAPYVKYNDSSVEGNFVISGNLVLCASGDGHIFAFPSGSQIPCWDVNIGEPVAGITVAENRLYAAGYSGWMYCIDTSPDY